MDLFDAVANRKSVREYLDKPVEREKLEKIVEAGRRAPSARAVEPWEFIVVTDKNSIKEIAEITDYGKFMAKAPAFIAVVCKDTKYYLEDGCAATENMLLAAAALDLSTCWVAGDKKLYAGHILKRLNTPTGYKLVSLISIGYSNDKSPNKKNRPLKEVIHWNEF